MNNSAFGTIAGLERKHYGTGYGCEFEADGQPYTPDFAAIARAFGAEGIAIKTRPILDRHLRGRLASRPAGRDRRPDAKHAGADAGGMGHRADLPGGPMTEPGGPPTGSGQGTAGRG